jgi:hypothetical protein
MLAAGGLQRMADETCEAIPFHYGGKVHAEMNAAGQGSIGGPGHKLGQRGMAHEPDSHEVSGIEGEIQECREVPEEIHGEVLGLVYDPHRQYMLAVGKLGYSCPSIAGSAGRRTRGPGPRQAGGRYRSGRNQSPPCR